MSKERRLGQHSAIREEIKDTARKLMAQEGTTGLSMRAIGRGMDLSAPALYHYYKNRDALITDLISDGFNNLGDALETARSASSEKDVAHQLIDVLIAYREWMLVNRIDFELIYGNPIPGYVAPEDVTVPAAQRGFDVIVSLISLGLSNGSLQPSGRYAIVPGELRVKLSQTVGSDDEVSVLAAYLTVIGWTRIHGMLMLELFEHIQPLLGDTGSFYLIQVREMLKEMGFQVIPG
jgi:AcrR family transcriptional regulator